MAFREKTTFVIGAGASAEFGLPIGTGLAAEIKKTAMIEAYDRENLSQNVLRELLYTRCTVGADQVAAEKALKDIHEGIQTAVSIDAFIHRHAADENISYWGKVLIALEVLKAERYSTLSPDIWKNFAVDPNLVLGDEKRRLVNPDYTWIGHFFRILSDGVADYSDLGKNITIICFNYDRCIEVYLAETISDAYRIPIDISLRLVNANIRIVHPYGYLGELALVSGSPGRDRLGFGVGSGQPDQISKIAENIHTYTEQAHDAGKVWSIHEAVNDCKNLIFLGFGFNNQNLDLLRVKPTFNGSAQPKNIYATGFGLYPQITETLTRRILDLFMDEPEHRGWLSHVHLEFGVGCGELFRIHDMNFSAFIQRYIRFEQQMRGMVSKVERYPPPIR
ncbi:hypothetical protein ACUTJJ_05250 [Agrobacterium sp. DKPNP3]|uniref:hypothetical protein n=1 Tax=Agrobacterium sp. DKPNP3 TaxID=3457323 RepID=UPI004044A7C5